MRNQIFSAIKVSTLALILSFGLSYVYAWTAPAVSAPGGNVAAPINTSSAPQIKAGAFTVGSFVTAGPATVGSLDTGTGNIFGWNVFANSLTTTGAISATGNISTTGTLTVAGTIG